MRILVVEDEKKIASFIKRGLKEKGYAVDVAYDGDEGLYLAKENPYDLIILDPPFTFFQAVHSYNNKKMQDVTHIRNLADKLLINNGIVISCGFNSTGLNSKKYNRNYEKLEILLINHGGSHNDTIILKERKINTLF